MIRVNIPEYQISLKVQLFGSYVIMISNVSNNEVKLNGMDDKSKT